MLNRFLIILYLIFSVLFFVYLWPNSKAFPSPPSEAVQSSEPADVETSLRRAYFTDLTRLDVMNHYKSRYQNLITLNFNYPPEEAQTIIRDQTRSYYLEELVHPFRESIYVNGFVPQRDSDVIVHEGRRFYQKITIRHVPTSRQARLFVGFLILTSIYITGYSLRIFIPKIKNISVNLFKLFI